MDAAKTRPNSLKGRMVSDGSFAFRCSKHDVEMLRFQWCLDGMPGRSCKNRRSNQDDEFHFA